jgi:hypothetical protein
MTFSISLIIFFFFKIVVSEETANGVDKTNEPTNGSPGLNSTNSETSMVVAYYFMQKNSIMDYPWPACVC